MSTKKMSSATHLRLSLRARLYLLVTPLVLLVAAVFITALVQALSARSLVGLIENDVGQILALERLGRLKEQQVEATLEKIARRSIHTGEQASPEGAKAAFLRGLERYRDLAASEEWELDDFSELAEAAHSVDRAQDELLASLERQTISSITPIDVAADDFEQVVGSAISREFEALQGLLRRTVTAAAGSPLPLAGKDKLIRTVREIQADSVQAVQLGEASNFTASAGRHWFTVHFLASLSTSDLQLKTDARNAVNALGHAHQQAEDFLAEVVRRKETDEIPGARGAVKDLEAASRLAFEVLTSPGGEPLAVSLDERIHELTDMLAELSVEESKEFSSHAADAEDASSLLAASSATALGAFALLAIAGPWLIGRTLVRPMRAQSELASIVAAAGDAVFSYGPGGEISSWNAAAERVYGYTAEEAIGRPVSDLFVRDTDLDDFERGLREDRIEIELQQVRKDGGIAEVALAGSRITDEVGRIAGTSLIGRDLTLKKKTEADARAAEESAQKASRLKSDFVASISHEIRTPMNAVIGMTELLLATGLDETQREYASSVHIAGKALLDIVNNILDFSQLESGRVVLDQSDFDPHQVIDDVADFLGPMAREKSLELIAKAGPEVPSAVIGDQRRVRQVLTALVSNAVRFTDGGSVTVAVSKPAEAEPVVFLNFEVSDTGAGIAPADLEMLFEPFYVVDSSNTRSYSGTGLGLSISKQLVELMGGELKVESSPGKGSRFWFELPLRRGDAPTPAQPQTSHGGPSTVLVAEDNIVNQKVAVAMLRKLGYEADVAANGQEAVEAASRSAYAAVLMDCAMPVMDGFEATRRIREQETGGRVPIIALTASSLPDDRRRCIEAGMDDYIAKPVQSRTLAGVLDKWVRSPDNPRPMETAPPPTV